MRDEQQNGRCTPVLSCLAFCAFAGGFGYAFRTRAASLMTPAISADSGTVIELGPGTGVFTEALLNRGVCQSDLILVEYGVDFARELTMRFPAATTLRIDAAQLRKFELQTSAPIGAS